MRGYGVSVTQAKGSSPQPVAIRSLNTQDTTPGLHPQDCNGDVRQDLSKDLILEQVHVLGERLQQTEEAPLHIEPRVRLQLRTHTGREREGHTPLVNKRKTLLSR